jgi:autotransporter-associated beta strand protein
MKPSSFSPHIEVLEARIAPAVHTWIGTGADNLWSNAANWVGGSPATDASGDIDLVFPTNAAKLVVQNDIAGLLVDSITFSVGSGTSANGYTINGNAFTINTGAAGQDPFGIDVAAGVADPTNGITQTFNTNISLSILSDATFRTAEPLSRLTFNGDINLGTRTLTIDAAGANNANAHSFVITGAISFGSLTKNGGGTLELSGDNSYLHTTINNGNVLAESNTALGATSGTVTINDPARLDLRNGVTVVKTTLNLNSNALGGGIGASGNTENTFRGNVVLMPGAGGVAMGAGVGVANANTRLIIDGVISGATSTLSLNGAGVIEFTQNNSYSGVTNLNGNNGFGALQIDSPGGLGAAGAGNETQLNRNGAGPTGSSLWLNFDGTTAERVNFAGSGVSGFGAIRLLGDHEVTLTGNITFIAGAPWAIGVDSGSLTITGVIDDQGSNRALTKVGAGTLIIGGTSANTYSGGTIVNGGVLSVQNSSGNALGDTPTLGALNIASVNGGATLRVEAGFGIPNSVGLSPGGTLAGAGPVSGINSNGGIVSPGAGVGTLIDTGNTNLIGGSTFLADLNGATAGVTNDQLFSLGAVNLGSAKLALSGNFSGAPGASVAIVFAAGGVTGTFAGLPDGSRVAGGGQVFVIDYTATAVNLIAVAPQSDLTISANGRTATFTDADGDRVTVKSTKGTLDASDFVFGFTADNRQQLRKLNLDAVDAGANITITAKREPGGDGFANVGYIAATAVPLGAVSVDGDLGRIDAGAVKSLTVQSLGALGVTSQAPNGSLVSRFSGNLGKLTVKASIHGATLLGTASIGPVNVLGSFLGGRLSAGADLGAVSVRGDIIGTDAAPVIISGFGKAVAPTRGTDLAIKSLKVSGGVEFLRVLAGYDLTLTGRNADASITSISVGADWHASSVLAGVSAGADGFEGTADDAKLTTAGVRDTATIFSTIASLTIKGQAFGSTGSGDSFGIVAEQINRAKVGKATFKFDKGERDAADAFALASTGPGATGLPSDFFLREVTI